MDFFEISQSIRKVGKDKYVIGKQSSNPLVLVDGKSLETDIGIFKNIFADKSEVKDEHVELSNIDNLILKTGIFNNLSGAELTSIKSNLGESYINNLYLKTGSFDSLSGEVFRSSSGFTKNSFIDNLALQTGTFQDISGEVFRSSTGFTKNSFIDNLALQTGTFQDISGEVFYSEKGSSKAFYVSGINIAESIIKVSGDSISADLQLHEHINSLSGDLKATGAYLSSILDNLDQSSGQQIISGNYAENRFKLEEAFEEDEMGDIVPTNHPFISDPMWILKEDGDLELRANVWRYDTGPKAFTKDISF